MDWIKKSQKTIGNLKKKIQLLMRKSEVLEEEERELKKMQEQPAQEMRVSISVESAVKASLAILGIVAFAYLLLWIKGIIILFLVALFLAAAFEPSVDRLQQYHMPRALGIIIMYIAVLGVLVLMFGSLVPIIAEQISELAMSAKSMIQNVLNDQDTNSWFMIKLRPLLAEIWRNMDQTQIVSNLTNSLNEIASRLTDFAGNALGAVFTIFNGILNLVLVLLVAFFMILEKKHTRHFFNSLFPQRYSDYINQKLLQISERIGEWVRGQVLLGLAMGLLTLIVFWIIGLKYALTLALVAGIGEFIPYLGPVITFAAALLIALNQDPVLVLWLIPAYAVIQFIESNILCPLIIGKAVGLNPIVILFAMLAGATIGAKFGESFALGLVGMMLAVPVAQIISIFIEDYAEKQK